MVLDCIDRQLGSTLGEAVRESLYYSMERNQNLRKDQIPYRPDEFAKAIRMYFGAGSLDLIERMITRELTYSCRMEVPASGLVETIKAIMTNSGRERSYY